MDKVGITGLAINYLQIISCHIRSYISHHTISYCKVPIASLCCSKDRKQRFTRITLATDSLTVRFDSNILSDVESFCCGRYSLFLLKR